ncbi:hypothetical protein MOUN0_H06348 [Monosporozyma unispora]
MIGIFNLPRKAKITRTTEQQIFQNHVNIYKIIAFDSIKNKSTKLCQLVISM